MRKVVCHHGKRGTSGGGVQIMLLVIQTFDCDTVRCVMLWALRTALMAASQSTTAEDRQSTRLRAIRSLILRWRTLAKVAGTHPRETDSEK